MVELRQGGSSREAATANKLTPRPLFNLLYPLSPPPPPAPSPPPRHTLAGENLGPLLSPSSGEQAARRWLPRAFAE